MGDSTHEDNLLPTSASLAEGGVRNSHFWKEFAVAYFFNFICSLPIAYFPTKDASKVMVFGGPNGGTTVGWSMIWAAVFCGLLTPLISTCFIKKAARRGELGRVDPNFLQRHTFSCILTKKSTCTRTFYILSAATLLIALPLVLFFVLGCVASGYAFGDVLAGNKCSLPSSAYLTVQMLFTLVVQFPVFWLNLMACRGLVLQEEEDAGENEKSASKYADPAVV
jgi:hypothetical protein